MAVVISLACEGQVGLWLSKKKSEGILLQGTAYAKGAEALKQMAGKNSLVCYLNHQAHEKQNNHKEEIHADQIEPEPI